MFKNLTDSFLKPRKKYSFENLKSGFILFFFHRSSCDYYCVCVCLQILASAACEAPSDRWKEPGADCWNSQVYRGIAHLGRPTRASLFRVSPEERRSEEEKWRRRRSAEEKWKWKRDTRRQERVFVLYFDGGLLRETHHHPFIHSSIHPLIHWSIYSLWLSPSVLARTIYLMPPWPNVVGFMVFLFVFLAVVLDPSFFFEKSLHSYFLKILEQKTSPTIKVQLLQTLSILFENTKTETSICEPSLPPSLPFVWLPACVQYSLWLQTIFCPTTMSIKSSATVMTSPMRKSWPTTSLS